MRKRSGAAHEAFAQAAQHASDAGRRLVEIGSAIQDRAYEATRSRHRGSHDYAVRLRDHVSDYPLATTLATVGIAVAIGALVTVWLARR